MDWTSPCARSKFSSQVLILGGSHEHLLGMVEAHYQSYTGLNGRCGRMLVLAIALMIAGCAILMSEEDLLSEGISRTAEFAVDYETLARCFDRERQLPHFLGAGTPTEVPIDSLQIKTDLAMARYEHGISTSRERSYVAIIEFRGIEPNKTAVKAYAISSDWLDINWKAIEGCATAIRPG